MEQNVCACGRGPQLTECCLPIIKGERPAETAEELMRARYTAFTLKDMDFVAETHDPATRDENDMEANSKWANEAEFVGLEVLDTELGQAKDSKGYVEFRAQFKQAGKTQSHHERSLFLKKKGKWFFSEAKNPEITTFERAQPKVGRNDPCICGSGKKFKKCCGRD
ncbi:MAG: hypothetical protein CL677_09770 [Bdellovibrionaceae bacterium]|nr:hypothetical protein [Pseudobdellovibrionaceae bacterium]|tara:strand:+ start:63112 stop:63609 length:498 start_codon:yes stop_codon:yes gene_type:complete